MVNYSQRGGISVLTERQTKTSKLVIARAMASDSGNYTCSPSSSGKYISWGPWLPGRHDNNDKRKHLILRISPISVSKTMTMTMWLYYRTKWPFRGFSGEEILIKGIITFQPEALGRFIGSSNGCCFLSLIRKFSSIFWELFSENDVD